jgi:hypothetical protein
MKKYIGIISLILFINTIYAANYAVEHWGIVAVGFGLMAPAGVYFAGIAFTLRDIINQTLGRLAVILSIFFGAALSYLVSDAITIPGGIVSLAVASGVAFLLSELSDFSIYEPLRKKGFIKAVVFSNIVGLILDSILFLYLAFGSLQFLQGQIIGKTWMTLLAIPFLIVLRHFAKNIFSTDKKAML